MKPSKTQQRICQVLRAKVRFQRAGFQLPDSTLNDIDRDTVVIRETVRLYVQSWVEPLIDALETGEVPQWMKDSVTRDRIAPIGSAWNYGTKDTPEVRAEG